MIRKIRKIEVVDCPLGMDSILRIRQNQLVSEGRPLKECEECNFYKGLTLEGVDCGFKSKGDK